MTRRGSATGYSRGNCSRQICIFAFERDRKGRKRRKVWELREESLMRRAFSVSFDGDGNDDDGGAELFSRISRIRCESTVAGERRSAITAGSVVTFRA